MIPKIKIVAMTILLVTVCCTHAKGQAAPTTILTVDLENVVNYQLDTSDISKFASDPNVTTTRPVGAAGGLPGSFLFNAQIGDIVAVNGQPAKGTFTRHNFQLGLRTAPSFGQAIADTVRGRVEADTFEILKSDGTPIGTIVAYGLSGGSPPPGAPLSRTVGNFAIVGGTGAFLGARGQAGVAVTAQTIAIRQASVTEDPANRRRNGGGRARFVLQVIPMEAPQVVITAGFPFVIHSRDSSLVTAYNPAAAGETLRLFVSGLGPTKLPVDPGQPFPASPAAAVNSPVDVTVNGKSATVVAAVGLPGAVDRYQVDVQVPSDTAKGIAAVQLNAAWIQGPVVNIPVQ